MSLKMDGKFLFGEFEIDVARRHFLRDGQPVALDPKVFDLLAYMVMHRERVFSRSELIEVLGPDSALDESELDRHLAMLREELTGRLPGDWLIAPMPNSGLRFTGAVMEVHQAASVEGPMVAQETSLQPEVASIKERAATPKVDHQMKIQPETESEEEFPEAEQAGHLISFLRPGLPQNMLLTVLIALVAGGSWLAWREFQKIHPRSLRVVIADFQNSTGNVDFDPAVKTALAMDLRQSPFLNIASGEEVRQARRELNRAVDESLNLAAAREVCRKLSGQVYLGGKIDRFAQKYLITVQAFDCASGNKRGQSKGIADSPDAVLAVLNKVAVDIRQQMGESDKSIQVFSKPLFPARNGSLAAFKAYSEASRFAVEGRYSESIPVFKRAIELAPEFALAYADLGETYLRLGDQALADLNLTKAFELSGSVDEEDRLFIVARYHAEVTGDIQASIRNDLAWSLLYPRDPVPLQSLADLDLQIGKAAQALEPARRAIEINPTEARTYQTLARAQMQLGQFDEATATCELAIKRHLDDAGVHGILFQIAYLRLDQPAMDEQIAWAQGQPDETHILLLQGQMALGLGKVKAAQIVFASVVEAYRKQGKVALANSVLEAMPRMEVELGLPDAARQHLLHLPDESTSPAIPVSWAAVGDVIRASEMLGHAQDSHPADTLWQEDYIPQIRAAIALNQGKAGAAIDTLQVAAPYDLSSFEVPALRGRAYLAAKQPAFAEAEFQKILDHPGIEPLSLNYPLAQLGLARSLVQQGKSEDAVYPYKLLFTIWKDADPDLPALRAARAEYAKLNGPGQKISSPSSKPTPSTGAAGRSLPKPHRK